MEKEAQKKKRGPVHMRDAICKYMANSKVKARGLP